MSNNVTGSDAYVLLHGVFLSPDGRFWSTCEVENRVFWRDGDCLVGKSALSCLNSLLNQKYKTILRRLYLSSNNETEATVLKAGNHCPIAKGLTKYRHPLMLGNPRLLSGLTFRH